MPMCSRGVLVHYSSRLGAATPVLVVEVPRGDGVSAKRTLELAKALHHRNGVMSHNLSVVAYPGVSPKRKSSSHPHVRNRTPGQLHLDKHLR